MISVFVGSRSCFGAGAQGPGEGATEINLREASRKAFCPNNFGRASILDCLREILNGNVRGLRTSGLGSIAAEKVPGVDQSGTSPWISFASSFIVTPQNASGPPLCMPRCPDFSMPECCRRGSLSAPSPCAEPCTAASPAPSASVRTWGTSARPACGRGSLRARG